MSPDASNSTPSPGIPHSLELPESDGDLALNLPTIDTPCEAVPPRALAAALDERAGKTHGEERLQLIQSPLRLSYITTCERPEPALAVFLGTWPKSYKNGTVRMDVLIGYAEWLPVLTQMIRYPRRHGFPRRCQHAWRDHVYHGTSDQRCGVNDQGAHWVADCPGQTRHESEVQRVGSDQAAANSRPLLARPARINWSAS